jgi:hypothetical protein
MADVLTVNFPFKVGLDRLYKLGIVFFQGIKIGKGWVGVINRLKVYDDSCEVTPSRQEREDNMAAIEHRLLCRPQDVTMSSFKKGHCIRDVGSIFVEGTAEGGGKNGDRVVGSCEQGEESIDSLIVQRGWLDDGSDIIASYEVGFYTR